MVKTFSMKNGKNFAKKDDIKRLLEHEVFLISNQDFLTLRSTPNMHGEFIV